MRERTAAKHPLREILCVFTVIYNGFVRKRPASVQGKIRGLAPKGGDSVLIRSGSLPEGTRGALLASPVGAENRLKSEKISNCSFQNRRFGVEHPSKNRRRAQNSLKTVGLKNHSKFG